MDAPANQPYEQFAYLRPQEIRAAWDSAVDAYRVAAGSANLAVLALPEAEPGYVECADGRWVVELTRGPRLHFRPRGTDEVAAEYVSGFLPGGRVSVHGRRYRVRARPGATWLIKAAGKRGRITVDRDKQPIAAYTANLDPQTLDDPNACLVILAVLAAVMVESSLTYGPGPDGGTPGAI